MGKEKLGSVRAQGFVYDRKKSCCGLCIVRWKVRHASKGRLISFLNVSVLTEIWPLGFSSGTNALIGCDAVRGLQRILSSAAGPIHPQVWSANGRKVASVGT